MVNSEIVSKVWVISETESHLTNEVSKIRLLKFNTLKKPEFHASLQKFYGCFQTWALEVRITWNSRGTELSKVCVITENINKG